MKDPAFLFYTSDFLTGTMLMSDEQVGKYIKLLCLQHQKGRLSEKHMLSICKAYDQDIYEKFVKDHNNYYYNIRLEEEIIKRSKYTESRRNNAKGRNTNTKKPIKAYAKHMENENINENINRNKEEKRTVTIPFTTENFSDAWRLWKEYKYEQFKFKYKPLGEQSALNGIVKKANGFEQNAIDIINYSMSQGYRGLFKENNNGTNQQRASQAERLLNKIG